MIKEKEIMEFRPQVRYQDGASINLGTIQDALSDCARSHGVPLAFGNGQIRFGGLIMGSTVDCLVVYHPEHRSDYYNFLIEVKHQGNYAFVSCYGTGRSKQIGKSLNAEQAGNEAKAALKGIAYPGGVGKLIGAGIKGVLALGKNKQKLEEEQNWYAMVSDIFNETIS